jgi:magnesium-dependent phosphatase-1
MKLKAVIFDADNTIWDSGSGGFVSQLKSGFKLEKKDVVKRIKDGVYFKLNRGVRDFMIRFNQVGGKIGMMSDNHYEDVKMVCKLFDIWQYFEASLVKIKLYKGYCPKPRIIKTILEKRGYQKDEVVWFDDKDYKQAALNNHLNFIQVKNNQLEKILPKLV